MLMNYISFKIINLFYLNLIYLFEDSALRQITVRNCTWPASVVNKRFIVPSPSSGNGSS